MGKTSQRNQDKLFKILSKYGTLLYGITCLGLTLFLAGESLHQYLENSDTSVMNPRIFNERPSDVYPTYTICFVDERIHAISGVYKFDGIYRSWYVHQKKGVNWPTSKDGRKPWHKYRDFLTGADLRLKLKEKDKKERQLMSDIDFIKATKPLSHFMEMMEVVEIDSNITRNIKIERDPINPQNRSLFDSMLYLSYQSPTQICYTRKLDDDRRHQRIDEKLKFLGSVVYNKHLSDMYLYVHHPGQFYRKKSQVLRIDLLNFKMHLRNVYHYVEITTTDIFRKRIDAEIPCDRKMDLNDDKYWVKSAVDSVNCIPPFWKPFYEWKNSSLLTCKTSEQFRMVRDILTDRLQQLKVMERYKRPCAEMSISVIKDHFEYNPWESNRITKYEIGNVTIIIKYPGNTYHEILNERKVSFYSFWSSTGGFIGMFLGFSLMQLPQIISELVMWSTNKNN